MNPVPSLVVRVLVLPADTNGAVHHRAVEGHEVDHHDPACWVHLERGALAVKKEP
jgi:hypothetical protein